MTEFDPLIRGGTVVDGSDVPRYRADVGIKDGRIARIGRLGHCSAAKVLDASGLIVAPGAIDLHTHYDAQRGDSDGADAADDGFQLGNISAMDGSPEAAAAGRERVAAGAGDAAGDLRDG